MTEFVQRRPKIQAVEYDGSRPGADRVMAEFVRPPDQQLEEFRTINQWDESRVQADTVYKWYWYKSGDVLDRPAVLAGGQEFDTGARVAHGGLWFGYEGAGAGTGVERYYEIPVGYVYTGWALKPGWMARADFLKDWEPVEAAAT